MSRHNAAAVRRGMTYSLCPQQRALKRFGRRHVGPGRTLAYTDADAGAREVDATTHDLALLDEAVDRRRIGQEHVDRFASLKAGQQGTGWGIARADSVAVRALERRQQLVCHRLDRGRDECVDVGSLNRRDLGEDDCERAHGARGKTKEVSAVGKFHRDLQERDRGRYRGVLHAELRHRLGHAACTTAKNTCGVEWHMYRLAWYGRRA